MHFATTVVKIAYLWANDKELTLIKFKNQKSELLFHLASRKTSCIYGNWPFSRIFVQNMAENVFSPHRSYKNIQTNWRFLFLSNYKTSNLCCHWLSLFCKRRTSQFQSIAFRLCFYQTNAVCSSTTVRLKFYLTGLKGLHRKIQNFRLTNALTDSVTSQTYVCSHSGPF